MVLCADISQGHHRRQQSVGKPSCLEGEARLSCLIVTDKQTNNNDNNKQQQQQRQQQRQQRQQQQKDVYTPTPKPTPIQMYRSACAWDDQAPGSSKPSSSPPTPALRVEGCYLWHIIVSSVPFVLSIAFIFPRNVASPSIPVRSIARVSEANEFGDHGT